MASREEASRLCRDGVSPIEIAQRMGKEVQKIRELLLLQVAEGALRRSEIFLSFVPARREAFERYISESESEEYWPLVNSCAQHGLNRDEFRLYLDCRSCKRGDLYEYISEIEVYLHEHIRSVLERKFGCDESGWWRNGVPTEIRASCVEMRERDPEPAPEPFCYTNFIHLSTILESSWNVLAPMLPRKLSANKKELLGDLRRLNHIRNVVMHPAKGIDPTDDDLRFAQTLHDRLGLKA